MKGSKRVAMYAGAEPLSAPVQEYLQEGSRSYGTVRLWTCDRIPAEGKGARLHEHAVVHSNAAEGMPLMSEPAIG